LDSLKSEKKAECYLEQVIHTIMFRNINVFLYITHHMFQTCMSFFLSEHKIRYFKECSVVLKMKVLCDWVSERTG